MLRELNKTKELNASIVYIVVGLINKSIGIITVPLFTRLLTTEEMGTFSTWISWSTIFLPIITLSLTGSSFLIAMNEYKNERDEYSSTVLSMTMLSGLIWIIVYLLFKNAFNRITTLSTFQMIFMFLYLMFSSSMDIWLIRQRYEYNTKKMAAMTLASNLIASICSIIVVIIFRNSHYDKGAIRIFSMYSVLIIFGVFLMLKIFKNSHYFISKKYIKFSLRLSLPLIIHTLAKNILDVSDRTMISWYCGKGDAGIYGTVYSISVLSLIIWIAINNAFVPYLYDKLSNETLENLSSIKKVSYSLVMVYGVICVLLTAVAPEIITILTTEEYFSAVYIIPPISAGIFLTCLYNLFANVILYHKKTTVVMIGTFIAAVTNVILNYIFLPKFGYYAAAYTTLVSFIILSIIQGIEMKKIHKKNLYDLKLLFSFSAIIIIVCLSFNFIYAYTILRYMIIFLFLVFIYVKRMKIINILKLITKKKV